MLTHTQVFRTVLVVRTWKLMPWCLLSHSCSFASLRRYTGNEEYKSFCILRSILLIVVKHDSASLNCTKPRVERLVNHSLRGGSKAWWRYAAVALLSQNLPDHRPTLWTIPLLSNSLSGVGRAVRNACGAAENLRRDWLGCFKQFHTRAMAAHYLSMNHAHRAISFVHKREEGDLVKLHRARRV